MNQQFFNTTNEEQPVIGMFREKAEKQNDIILKLLRNERSIGYSPSDVHGILFDSNTPITSVRRSITVLTNKGNLVKTKHKKESPNGRPEHIWRLNSEISTFKTVKQLKEHKDTTKQQALLKIANLGSLIAEKDKETLRDIWKLVNKL